MPAPTNTSFLTATDLGTITASPGITVTQRVDDSGTTYTVYYSFTAPAGTVEVGAFGFGDLVTYQPTMTPYRGPASAPTQVSGIAAVNVPMQIPVTAGSQYFLKIVPNGGNPTPANLTLNVQLAPNATVPVGSFAVPDDQDTGLPLSLLSSTADYTALKYIAGFPSGEGGDTLANGTVAVEDISNSSVKLYNASYQLLSSHTLIDNLFIRTCLTPQKFYLATSSNPTSVYTLTSTGTLSSAEVLTGMTSCSAVAAANDESKLYHAFAINNTPIRTWNLLTHTAGANLAAAIANYQTFDILVLSDNTLIVSYYKSTATRDFMVKHYDAAGTTLNTYSGFPVPSGVTAPRLAYAIDDPNSFWVMMATSTTGLTQFFNVKISDGSLLTTRNQEQFENGVYGGTATATPLARFGAAFSCPFWITRSVVQSTTTYPIRRQRRFLLPSSPDQKTVQIPIIELLMRTGIGLLPNAWGSSANNPQGANPQVLFRLSKDGGETWGPERSVSAGLRGDYEDRVRLIRATGNYRNAMLEVTVTDPVDWQFLAALAPAGILEGSN